MDLTEIVIIGLVLALAFAFPSTRLDVEQDNTKKIDLGREPRSPADVFQNPPSFAQGKIVNDRLAHMWVQQVDFMHLLQEKRGFPEFPTDITSKKGQQFLEGIYFHIMKELFEAGQHLKNSKSHRATEVPTVDREAYKEELVDALHLYFELVIASGITLNELVEAYLAKGEINVDRIKNGY